MLNSLQVIPLQVEFVECNLNDLIFFALECVQKTADVICVSSRPVWRMKDAVVFTVGAIEQNAPARGVELKAGGTLREPADHDKAEDAFNWHGLVAMDNWSLKAS